MKTKLFLLAAQTALVGLTLFMTLSGCVADGGAVYSSGGGTAVVVADDYDYYPGYETYYSRTHHDYYYRDTNNKWVRRPQPAGVRPEQFHAAPSVHMDFHDAPDKHHATVAKSYPKNWRPPAQAPAPQPNHNDGDHRPNH